ncbi:MAG: MMPL family transporter [Sulfurovum sp.]|uniref:efflux RND transporter permease subunit n=1 Tax=Sulfurovum sp. TaxID=1969726 RepID=UPI002867B605|nr:MMPL family transporter [Sulfurovum sp.]MCO4845345.1 MMPL family transporter [Sulfurovum sp.]
MDHYVEFLNRFKWIIIAVTCIIMIGLFTQSKNFAFEGSYRIWFGKDSTILKEYDRFRATYGSDDMVIVAFHDDAGIFTLKALSSIARVSSELSSLPNISRVDSIINYQYIFADPDNQDDIIVEDFISSLSDLTIQELQQKEKIATNDPLVSGLMVSKDGKTAMIAAKRSTISNEKEAMNIALINATKKILDKEHLQSGYDFYISGGPAINAALVKIASNDAAVYLPMAFGIMILILWLFFRNILGVVIPLMIVIGASLITLSIHHFLGLKLNNFTVNIPIFIAAIGIADAVHFYIAWIHYRYKSLSNHEAIAMAIRHNIIPMTLTTLTTAIGFVILTNSEIVPISSLGLAIAIGSVSALALTMFLVPIILLILPTNYLPRNIIFCQLDRKNIFDYSSFIIHNYRYIIALCTVTILLSSIGFLWVKMDSNSLKYFSSSVDVRQAADFTMKNITGPQSYEIIIDSHYDDGIKDPKFLMEVERFSHELKNQYPEIRHTSSLLDIMKRFHDVINPSHSEDELIGGTKEINAQYLLLYSLSLPQGMEINDKMDLKQRQLRMTAQSDIVDSSQTLEMIAWVERWWENTPYEAHVGGQTAMFTQMETLLTNTLVYSLGGSMLMIAFIMILIIRNLKLLIIFLVPNVFPVLFMLGMMGWLSVPIDLGIALASAIVLGLAVDNTIYFFTHYFESQKQGLSMEESFDAILEHSGSAMLYTTFILSGAFFTFLFSDFIPNVHFAFMTFSTLIMALISDVFLTPALLTLANSRRITQK